MNSIRIENLRCFKDTGDIELQTLNLLIGQNSSGKSSFLRFFPLIKQSILRSTKGPILWYDESLVDFGSFTEAKNKYCPNETGIKFSFNLELGTSSRLFLGSNPNFEKDINASISISIIEKSETIIINKLIIEIKDQIIELELEQDSILDKFIINGKLFSFQSEVVFANLIIHNFLPVIALISDKNTPLLDYFESEFIKKIETLIGSSEINDKNKELLINTGIGSKDYVLDNIKKIQGINTLAKKSSKWNIEDKDFIEINNLLLAFNTTHILNSIDEAIVSFFSDCDYTAPVRAKALRYYRRQDLSIVDIDAYGDNLHMFIDNLSASEKKSFRDFVSELFGFTIETKSDFGHITINIKNINEESFNLADLGFGYSQLLPIITKLWNALYKENKNRHSIYRNTKQTIILIEQPELHLHPAMQAQVADAIIKAIEIAKEKKIQIKFIIETHSTVLINRIGKKVRDKQLPKEQVNVVLFELDKDLKYSNIKTTNFNEKGIINNWPLGFLEPKN